MHTKPVHLSWVANTCSERFDRLRYSTFESDVYRPSGPMNGKKLHDVFGQAAVYMEGLNPALVGEGDRRGCSRGPQGAKPIESNVGDESS